MKVLLRTERSVWIYDLASEDWVDPVERTREWTRWRLAPGHYIAVSMKRERGIHVVAWTFVVKEDGAVVNEDVIVVRRYSEPYDALREPDEAVRELAGKLIIAKMNDLEKPAPLSPETAMRLVARARAALA